MIPLAVQAIHTRSFSELLMGFSPEAYWRLNESSGTVAADETGDHDAVISGCTLAQAAVRPNGDTSFYFDGSSTVIDSTGLVTSGSITVGAWVKTTETGEAPLCSRDDANSNRSWQLKIKTGGYAEFIAFNGSGADLLTSPLTYNDGNPHFIVGVYDSSTPKAYLYVDGQEVVSTTDVSGGLVNKTTPIYIGADDTQTNERLTGYLQDVFIVLSPLSSQEIAALYAAR
jgi:hypothetical protein